jgi:hypothetical protein
MLLFDGHATSSLTFGKEHGLRVFKNRALKRIYMSKREEVTGVSRKLPDDDDDDDLNS